MFLYRYYLKALSHVLLLVFIRRNILLLLFLVISIPTSIAILYSLISPIFTEETSNILSFFSGRESIVLLDRAIPTNKCIEIYITNTLIVSSNKSLYTNTFLLDIESYRKFFNSYITSENISIFIGQFLSSALGIGKGSIIDICFENICKSYRVLDVVRSSFTSSSILLVYNNTMPISGVTKRYYLCRQSVDSHLYLVIEDLRNSLENFTKLLSLLIISIYPPIMFIGFRRIYSLIQTDLSILHENGIPIETMRRIVMAILMLLSIAMFLYGICLGIFSMHLSLWILRFFNIFIGSRPLPAVREVIPILSLFTVFNILMIIIVSRGWKGNAL